MPRTNKLAKSPPAEVERILIRLGQNIQTARLRRNLRLEDLAERLGISRYLMSDVEKGKPTAAIATYIGALWAMGLTGDLYNIADPNHDAEGKALENARLPSTAAKRRKVFDNDF